VRCRRKLTIRETDGYEMQFGRRRLAVTGAPVISAGTGKCEKEPRVRDGGLAMRRSGPVYDPASFSIRRAVITCLNDLAHARTHRRPAGRPVMEKINK